MVILRQSWWCGLKVNSRGMGSIDVFCREPTGFAHGFDVEYKEKVKN